MAQDWHWRALVSAIAPPRRAAMRRERAAGPGPNAPQLPEAKPSTHSPAVPAGRCATPQDRLIATAFALPPRRTAPTVADAEPSARGERHASVVLVSAHRGNAGLAPSA